jgi:hypothetical protein
MILYCIISNLVLGKDAYLGPIEDEGKQAQEYLEILKLRFQQVGVTNPAAWAGTSPH